MSALFAAAKVLEQLSSNEYAVYVVTLVCDSALYEFLGTAQGCVGVSCRRYPLARHSDQLLGLFGMISYAVNLRV